MICLLLYGHARAQDINPLSKQIIQSVSYSGLIHVKDKHVPKLGSLKTKVGFRASPATLDQDLRTIYLSGYFKHVSIKTKKNQDGIDIIFLCSENAKINAIKFVTPPSVSKKELKKIMRNTPGKILNLNTLSEDRRRIESFYTKRGYALFKLLALSLDDKNNLIIDFSEGKISTIEIQGLTKIKPAILLRDLALKKGKVFNSKLLRSDRETLLKTGYFSSVSAPKLIQSSQENTVKIIFKVTEKKANKINVGLEQEQEEFVGFLSGSRNHNFIQSDLFTGKVQVSNENQEIGVKSYALSYYQPWFLNRYKFSLSSQFWTSFKQEISANQATKQLKTIQKTKRKGKSFKLGFPLIHNRLTLYTRYKNELITPEKSTNQIQPYNLHSLSSQLKYSSIANFANPRKGAYISIELEKGGPFKLFTLPGINFSRANFTAATFIPVKKNGTVAIRNAIGLFRPAERETFESESYIVGGANSLRGYDASKYPFFGTRKFILNTEYRHYLHPKIQIVLFYDIGYAQDTWNFSPSTFPTGRGIGLRFPTPVGPLRLDLAKGSDSLFLHFGLGQVF